MIRGGRLWGLAMGLVGTVACEDAPPPDPGSVCACLDRDGVTECCFGHGACTEREEGPRTCECDEGAQGDTCATPAPGPHPIRERDCTPGDPACEAVYDHVAVELYDRCTDLTGDPFEAIIVRPATADGAWPEPATYPLALLVHGASQEPPDYYDLLEHLAANGFVAMAFDATFGGDVTFRANRLLSFLQCLETDWSDRLEDRIGLVGHSRGGGAIAIAARALQEGAIDTRFYPAALVALAPARTDRIALPPGSTDAYLAIQGSRDPDTTGAALGWYDLADPVDTPLLRGLTWVFGATHQRFHQGLLAGGTGEASATLSGPEHWAIARAYIGGFLQWQLQAREARRDLFTNTTFPPFLGPASESPVYSGLHDSTAARLVLHDFEGETLDPPTVGGTAMAESGLRATVGPAEILDPPWSKAHATGAARIGADDRATGGRLRMTWEAPLAANDYRALHLRAGRTRSVEGECLTPEYPGPDLGITLDDGTRQHTVWLEAGASRPIPLPDAFDPTGIGAWFDGDCHAVDFLLPVSLELQAFSDAGVDLSQLQGLWLEVGPGSGDWLVDDLELL